MRAKSVANADIGRGPRVAKAFEEVKKLPRSQQRKIVDMVNAIVNDYKRKAS